MSTPEPIAAFSATNSNFVESPAAQITPENESSSSTPGSGAASDSAEQSAAGPSTSQQQTQVPSAGDWQAIWSPAHNAYYFCNTATQETTWTNPLQAPIAEATPPVPAGDAPADVDASAGHPSIYDLQAAAEAQGIDPALAYLDPSLVAGPSTDSGYTAKFNARTGAFARPDGREPSHLSEFERMKRMSEFYFDVNAWEQDVEARKKEEEAEGKKKKKLTKKDLERFKEQKRLKKIAKTAWLRT